MEENCKIYVGKTGSFLNAYVDDDGQVSVKVPCHGGFYYHPLSSAFLDVFGVTIYPG
jgi:hypothetical protein